MKKITILISLTLIIVLAFFLSTQIMNKKIYFKFTGKLLTRAAYQQAILINNTEALIIGGVTGDKDFKSGSQAAWIYSLKDKKTNKITNTNFKHLFHNVFKMQDGNIVIADINGIEIYDIKTKKFKLLKTRPIERYHEFYNYKYALLPNDLLVILGGRIKNNRKNEASSIDLNVGEIIDLKNDKLIKTFKIKGNGFGLVNLKDGNLLIIGGKKKTNKKELLSNAIYVLNSKTFTLTPWGELPVPIANPFCFLTNDDKVVIIGGEIFKKNEKYKNFNYIHTKGSESIYIINLNTKEITQKNISTFFSQFNGEPVKNNFILDVVQCNDKTYLLNIGRQWGNLVIFNIDTLKTEKISKSFNANDTLFKFSSIKLANRIYLFGGKLAFIEGVNEYSLDEQHPYTMDELLPSGDGFFVDSIQYVEYKNKGEEK